MKESTRQALLAINRVFYDDYAASFGSTRSRPWPAWTTLLQDLSASERPLRVLDVGCGNGRFGELAAEILVDRGGLDYEGWDQSAGLLQQARLKLDGRVGKLVLRSVDLGRDPTELPSTGETYDVIGMFGVLHHMPGREFRRRLLSALGTRLAPGGRLWASWWMLHQTDRFAKKIAEWRRLPEASGMAVDLGDLEPGDHLLTWQRDGQGLRYLHFPTPDELDELRLLPDLSWKDSLASDGPTGRENLYLCWDRARIRAS